MASSNTLFTSIVIAAIVVLNSCIPAKSDRYVGVRTKRFSNEHLQLQPIDTIFVIPPIVEVKSRFLLEKKRKGTTALRADTIGARRARGFTNVSVANLFKQYVNLKFIDSTQHNLREVYKDMEAMFMKFETDSVTSYSISEETANKLRSLGVKKLLVTKIFWEYYEEESYQIVWVPASQAGQSSSPRVPALILAFGVLIDTPSKQVISYNSCELRLEYNMTPNGGYWGLIPNDFDFPKKRTGQNLAINDVIKRLYKKLIKTRISN